MTEARAIEAIRVITEETGFPPDPDELCDVLGVRPRQLHAALARAKGEKVRYDDDGRFVLVKP